MVIEGFIHCFGVRTKAQELELHQQLVESQATYADLCERCARATLVFYYEYDSHMHVSPRFAGS